MALTEYDEFFIHQTGEPIDTVGVKDPHFMDRCWFGCHSNDGTTYIAAGLGTYPNAGEYGVMDASFCIIHKGVQRNFRASRHIDHASPITDRTNTVIGPFSIEILKPFRRMRVKLDKNEFDIGGSIEFDARVEPFLYNKLDVPQHPMTHFTQLGYFDGHVTFEEQHIPVSHFCGVRDRTWGVRGKGLMRHVEAYFWIMAHFDDFCINFTFFHVPVPGNNYVLQDGAIMHDDGRVTRLCKARHRFHFIETVTREGSTRLWDRLEVEFTDVKGEVWLLEVKAIAFPFYNAGQGYDDRHGLDVGKMRLEGERWDFTKADTIRSLRRTGDDRWHFDIHDQPVTATLSGAKGVGLVNNVCGPRDGWAYVPTL